MTSWSQWISANRKGAGLSKKQFAEVMGVGQHTVGDWEDRGRTPGKYARGKMAELFGEKL